MKKLLPLLILSVSSSFAGVYVDNTWNHNEVSVCFGAGEKINREVEGYVIKARSWSKKQKQLVEQWVKEEYKAERTGISFSGFEDCENAPDADVVIFHNKNSRMGTFIFGGTHGLSVIGPHSGSVDGYPRARAFVSISSSGLDKGTVVHEFGHTAGLQHEHNHYDAFKLDKGRCHAITKENSYFTTRLNYTEYDPLSVMNYCMIHGKGGSTAGLSEKDIELLNKLYP